MARLLFLARKPPHGTSFAREAVDAVLAASAFEQDISLVFDGDGVWQLLAGQDTTALGIKNSAAMLAALPMFDVEDVRVTAHSLQARNLAAADLLLPATVISAAELATLIAESDQVLSF